MTIDLRDYYPIHDECKRYLNELQKPKSEPSEQTILQYVKDAVRMNSDGHTPKSLCTSKNTYYKYRAAWSYTYRTIAKERIDMIKKMKENGKISEEEKPIIVKLITELEQAVNRIKKFPPDFKGENRKKALAGEYESPWQELKNNAPASKSKRNQRLPKNFEDRFFDYVAKRSKKYTDAVAVSLLSGCRPEELVSGVAIELQDNGSIKITIKGAKTHEKKYGQEERSFCIKTDNSAFNYLKEKLKFSSEPKRISIESPGAFGTQVTKYGKKCFPRLESTISPYNFRHNFSKKAKGSLSDIGVATVLGHCTNKSQSFYSKKNIKSSGGFEISEVKGSKEVKITRTTYQEYLRNTYIITICH